MRTTWKLITACVLLLCIQPLDAIDMGRFVTVGFVLLWPTGVLGDSNSTLSTSSSQSASSTTTQSFSSTQTPSRTSSPTASTSKSETLSPSATQAFTGTTTSTPSQTITQTLSQSQSSTNTATASQTTSQSRSNTNTRSQSLTPSTTQSLTGSSTPTPTQSLTRSPTMSPSETQSKTATPTASQTGTTSVTRSQTMSQSRSSSGTRSQSSTPSLTQSLTSSPTSTPSETTSQTQSRSETSTETGTLSSTPSESMTPTTTGTQTRSQSSSASGTRSQSPTLTRTSSQTSTGTGTTTQSASQTITQSQSSSQSASQSDTPSTSGTQSRSMSQTTSESSTPSTTESSTPSLTRTQTSTGSATPSQSRTMTQSPSQSSTSSQSCTSSVTATASSTRTETSSPSSTSSPSQSQSSSDTGTKSTSGTPSTTASASMTQTPSLTQSESSSNTQTASQTQSMTPSTTASQTQTPTQSSTPSPSQRPVALLMSPLPAGAFVAHDGSLALSDSLQAVAIPLRLSACPPSGPSRPTLQTFCWTTQIGLNERASYGSPVSVYVAVSPSEGLAKIDCVYDAVNASPRPVPLGDVSVTVGGAYGSGGGLIKLVCETVDASSRTSIARGELIISVTPTRWPLWHDAIVISPEGLLRSVLLGVVLNASRALASVCATYGDSANISTACVRRPGTATPPLALLDLLQDAWRPIFLPNASNVDIPFALTLTTTTRLALRSLATAFYTDTVVTLGRANCTVLAVSQDGTWILLQTPDSMQVCGSSSPTGECGYEVLTVTNPASSGTAVFSSTSVAYGIAVHNDADNAARPYRGASLACPDFCPGSSGGVRPVAVDATANPMLEWATTPHNWNDGTLYGTPLRVPRPITSSDGVYVAGVCVGASSFSDPTLGSCTNMTDPTSVSCALWRDGGSCSACPETALCPGGNRLWPRAGYYITSDTDPSLIARCAPPDPQLRCLGWSITSGAVQCGIGYENYLCAVCSPRFYGADDGSCNACPVVTSAWARYSGLVYIAVGIICVVALVYAGLFFIVWTVGGTITGGAFRMINLALWSLTTAQVFSDVAAVSSRSLPPLIRALYNSVSVLQLQSALLPPSCTGAYPFETQVATMVIANAAWVVSALVFYVTPRRMVWLRFLAQNVLVLAFVLYPSTVVTSSSLLNCKSVPLSEEGARALDGGGIPAAEAARANGGTVYLPVLTGNPFFVCWAGNHFIMGVFAAVTLGIYATGMPLMTLWWLWRDPWVQHSAATYAAKEFSAREASRKSRPAQVGSHLRCTCRRRLLSTTGPHDFGSKGDILLSAQNPLHRAAPSRRPPSKLVAPPALEDAVLGLFFYDYKPSAWWQRHTELALLLVLSLFRGLLPTPVTLNDIVMKTVMSAAALLASLVHVLMVQPFVPEERWMGWVRAALLVDSIGCTLLNGAVDAADANLATLGPSINGGAYVLVVACVATLCVLLGGFGWHMYSDALREEARKRLSVAPWGDQAEQHEGQRLEDSYVDVDDPVGPPLQLHDQPLQGVPLQAHQCQVVPVDTDKLGSDIALVNPLHLSRAGGFVSTVLSGQDIADTRRLSAVLQPLPTRTKKRLRKGVSSAGSVQRRSERRAAEAVKTIIDDSTGEASLRDAYSAIAALPPQLAKAVGPELLPALVSRAAATLAAPTPPGVGSSDARGDKESHDESKIPNLDLLRALTHVTDHSAVSLFSDALTALAESEAPAALAGTFANPAADPAVVAQSLWLLGNVSSDPRFCAAFTAAKGGLAGVLGLLVPPRLHAHPNDHDIPLHALVALTGFAASSHGREALVDAGAVGVVCGVLREMANDDVGVAIAGCHALDALLQRSMAGNEVSCLAHALDGATSVTLPCEADGIAWAQRTALWQLAACDGIPVLTAILDSERAYVDVEVAFPAASALAAALGCCSDVDNSPVDPSVYDVCADAALTSGATGAVVRLQEAFRSCDAGIASEGMSAASNAPLLRILSGLEQRLLRSSTK